MVALLNTLDSFFISITSFVTWFFHFVTIAGSEVDHDFVIDTVFRIYL